MRERQMELLQPPGALHAARKPAQRPVQRKASDGRVAPAFAPHRQDAGQPLAPALRGSLEGAFGRDLGGVRIHDDAVAHDQARTLGARAFATGTDISFAQGQYRPETTAGRSLLAHEVAHVMQQAEGVMTSGGRPPEGAESIRLEVEADRAAAAFVAGRPLPAFTPARTGTIQRAPEGESPAPQTTAVPPNRLPEGLTVVRDDPPGLGTTELVVRKESFELPLEKGMGAWVQQAHDAAASGGRLVFTPIFTGNGVAKYAAFKEGNENYKSIWLNKFGFKTENQLSKAFRAAAQTEDDVKTAMADPPTAAVVNGLRYSLKASKCDIDHIVEKQMGGTSIPSNLQLLTSAKNQASGRETYEKLVGIVDEIRTPAMRGPQIRKLQIQIGRAVVPAGTTDGSYLVEKLLRDGKVKGDEEVKRKAQGSPVGLSAGGMTEVVNIKDTGTTIIEKSAKRLIPGVRLKRYIRGQAGPRSRQDKIEGQLDSLAFSRAAPDSSKVFLTASLMPAAATSAEAPPSSEETAPPAAAAPAAGEMRSLTLTPGRNRNITFFYPYLSPGTLTTLAFDDAGTLTAKGVIRSTLPILGNVNVTFVAPRTGDDKLSVDAPIEASKLKPRTAFFRFTSGSLSLQLTPSFVPKGDLEFTVGPAANPIIAGSAGAKLVDGVFQATGTLKPARKIPGIASAEGSVNFHAEKGWSGLLQAKTSTISGATVDAQLGFKTVNGRILPEASGGLATQIRNNPITFGVKWAGGPVFYHGSVTIVRPIPIVQSVKLSGSYSSKGIYLKGEAPIKWRNIDATMSVYYSRQEGGKDRFGGAADIAVRQGKAAGTLNLKFSESGAFWGGGSITYQVNDKIRPTLGVQITKKGRIKVLGEVAIGDLYLTKKWPAPDGATRSIIKGIGAKFPFPLPPPVSFITAFIEVRGKLGVRYFVGPVMLTGVVFNGSLYPLEEDPQVTAKLTGKFKVPAYAGLYGTFGAYIGLEVASGAVGAKGGVDVTPELGVQGEGGIDVEADYDAGGFAFSAEAYAKGSLVAKVAIDLVASVYAAYGLYSHDWTYRAKEYGPVTLGPELNVKLGKIAYAKDGTITWPNLSQISVEPSVNPKKIVNDFLNKGQVKKR